MIRVSGLRGRWLLGAAAILAAGSVTPAAAADLGGDCCADLEERIAELEATTARKGNRKVSLTVSGFVNEAIQWWDDGHESNAYFVTNEEERSRFRFTGKAKITDGWDAGYTLEIGVRTHQENKSTQLAAGASAIDVRYSFWYLQSKDFGKASVGLVQSAGYHITEMTTANTSFFGKEGLGGWVGSNGSGYFLRKDNGDLSTLHWGDVLAPGPGTNKNPGEGDRLNGVRYDTPTIAGFIGSAFWGEDDVWDIALRYTGEISGFKLAGGIAYGEYIQGDLTGGSLRGSAVFGGRSEINYLGLSGSIMHKETGLYVYGAYGQQHDDERQAVYGAPVDDEDTLYYLQGGIERKWFSVGRTTIFGEYENDDVGAGIKSSSGGKLASDLGGGAFVAGTNVDTWGIGFNQNFENSGLDLYINYRNLSADVLQSATGLKTGATSTSESFQTVVGGAKIEF
jgi:predicted porin